jgi:cellulose synthase/poly-beta-1,6-N-acetylglucosamine synthase-like glycosyltransferase
MSVAGLLFTLLLWGLWLLLFAAGLHLVRLSRWAFFAPPADPGPAPPSPTAEKAPAVTVMLPMRNERYVARRAIESACRLDWPREKLEILVLDDSDDDTRDIVDAAVQTLRDAGHAVSVRRRGDRKGYKAGALDEALPEARGELIAILDADFVPSPDFLRRLVPRLQEDPRLAFVQGRWSFLNETENVLTRLQALILHGLMLVEQPYLSAHKKPVQFNGTGGIWRRSVLLSAGGFMGGGGAASVTEDMDLSYRACLLGYRGRHLPEVAVPTELPATMAAFRAQQQRWVRGGAEVLRSLLGKLFRGTLPAAERLTLLSHLLRHARQPYLSRSLLWLPAVALGWVRPSIAPPGGLLFAIGFVAAAMVLYYGAAQRRLGRGALQALLLAPLLLPLSMGLSLALSSALLRGLFAERAGAEFVRTPKLGDSDARTLAAQRPGYAPRRDRLARLEVLLGCLYVVLAGLALFLHQPSAALGLGLFCGAGLLWVGLGSVRSVRMPRL